MDRIGAQAIRVTLRVYECLRGMTNTQHAAQLPFETRSDQMAMAIEGEACQQICQDLDEAQGGEPEARCSRGRRVTTINGIGSLALVVGPALRDDFAIKRRRTLPEERHLALDAAGLGFVDGPRQPGSGQPSCGE